VKDLTKCQGILQHANRHPVLMFANDRSVLQKSFIMHHNQFSSDTKQVRYLRQYWMYLATECLVGGLEFNGTFNTI